MKIRIVIATSNGLDLKIRTVAMQDEKICEEESGEELEEAMHQQNPNLRRKVHSTKLYR